MAPKKRKKRKTEAQVSKWYVLMCRWITFAIGSLISILIFKVARIASHTFEDPGVVPPLVALLSGLVFSLAITCFLTLINLEGLVVVYVFLSKKLPFFPSWVRRESLTLARGVRNIALNLVNWLRGADLKELPPDDNSDPTDSDPERATLVPSNPPP